MHLACHNSRGWSGGAKVLGKLSVPGRPTILITVGQGPTALAVGAGGGCLDIFTLLYPFSSLSPSLWETARYRLKYCLKGPLNPKQPTNKCHNSLLYRLFRFRNTPDYTTVLSANIKDTAQRARPCFKLPVPACHLKCNIIIIILFI